MDAEEKPPIDPSQADESADGIDPSRDKASDETTEREEVHYDIPPAPEESQSLEVGSTVGDYIITQRLGQGGMCEVYKGLEPSLNRYVAIKVMLKEMQTESALKDFLEEARVIARFRHSNIVPLYSVGELHGLPWLAMGYIDGPNLEMYLYTQRPFTLDEAKDFMNQATSALQYAAKSNVIHLDIKPANFIRDPQNFILLADFGLARRLTDIKSGALDDQELLGTPAYASPEHILQLKPDLRTDIYCLGVTLYQMITGDLPFNADDTEAVCRMHLMDPFPVEKAKDQGLPDGWINFIKKMMEKKPEDRFQTYEELRKGLENIDNYTDTKLHIEEDVQETSSRKTLPRSGGVPDDLFYLIPHDMANKGGDLFRLGRPVDPQSVMDTLDSRWPILKLNAIAERLLTLNTHKEADINDTLWALAKIPQYKDSLNAISHFMATDVDREIKDDDEKLEFVGIDRTRNLAITSRAFYEDWQPDKPLNHHNLLEHSVYTGLLAGLMSDMLELPCGGFEYACGLLHDIGKFLFFELYPTKTIALWIQAYKKNIPLEELEMKHFGVTHNELGAEWLSRHRFHKVIIAVTRTQGQPENCFDAMQGGSAMGLLRTSSMRRPEVETLAVVVGCANNLAKELGLGYSGSPYMDETPWVDQPLTQNLLELNQQVDIKPRDFYYFFTETCKNLPDLALFSMGHAEFAYLSRPAAGQPANPPAQ